MKKILALALATITALSCSMVAFASTTSSTTLTTTVPAATYTLNIPANMEIAYKAIQTPIGSVSVSDAGNFGLGKNLKVTLTLNPFECDNVETVIPYHMLFESEGGLGGIVINPPYNDSITFKGLQGGGLQEYCQVEVEESYYDLNRTVVCIELEDWEKALAGNYTSELVFTAEVVTE